MERLVLLLHVTVWIQFCAVITQSIFSQIFTKTPHSLSMRVRYGVSVVNINSHLFSASVTRVLYSISCCIGSCYNCTVHTVETVYHLIETKRGYFFKQFSIYKTNLIKVWKLALQLWTFVLKEGHKNHYMFHKSLLRRHIFKLNGTLHTLTYFKRKVERNITFLDLNSLVSPILNHR